MTITNRRELADAVNEAYDAYLDKVDALAEEYKIVPGSPRQVQDDPKTHALCGAGVGRIQYRARSPERQLLRISVGAPQSKRR